jgi:hypothetical protein
MNERLRVPNERNDWGFNAGGPIRRTRTNLFGSYERAHYGIYTFTPGPPQEGEHPLTFAQTFGTVDLSYGQTQASAFVQDDVRVSSRVTASLGLRYEVQSVTDARANFAPRAGLSWDLTGDGRTIVRSGGGIFYDQYYLYLTRRYTTLGPNSPQITYNWSWGDPGFPVYPDSFLLAPTGKLAGARDIMIPGDRLLNPHSFQFSLGVERQIAPGLVLDVKGLRSHTSRQMRVNDINHPDPFVRTAPGQVRAPQVANQSRPYGSYNGVSVRDIAQIENAAETTYQSLDVGLTRRYSGWGQLGPTICGHLRSPIRCSMPTRTAAYPTSGGRTGTSMSVGRATSISHIASSSTPHSICRLISHSRWSPSPLQDFL